MKQRAPLVEVMSQIAHIRSNAAPTNELIGSCSILHYLSGAEKLSIKLGTGRGNR